MPDEPRTGESENKVQRLVQMVEGQDLSDDRVQSSEDGALSDAEVQELLRLKVAFDFIEQVRSDEELEQARETGAIGGDRTISLHEDTDVQKSPALDQDEPTKVARFEVIRLLGTGGFAKVYLAKDPLLDRLVALKILRTSLFFSEEATSRFDREAKAAAVLSHPNIVPVFETGLADTDWFIASGYCAGMTLQEWLAQQQNQVDPVVAARILVTLAQAVEHAHQRGIVHRDLKPANILIESENDNASVALDPDNLQIADFGLAKFTESSDFAKTTEGTIVGTPAYMSPEQARGDKQVSGSADIYSLGVILYEFLTGRLPILGKTNIETMLAIVKLEPAPPSKYNPQIAKDLEAICLKCLNKSPEDRYASAYQLSEDLNRWLAGKPVMARPVPRVTRLVRWCRRNPALTAAFIGISAALAVALTQWRSALHENQRADRHLMMAQDVIVEMVSGVVADPLLPPQLRTTMTKRSVELQKQLLAENPDDPRTLEQTGAAYMRLIVLLYDLSEFELAEIAADEALAILEPHVDDPTLAEIKTQIVHRKVSVLRAMQKIDDARQLIEANNAEEAASLLSDARRTFELAMVKTADRTDLPAALTEFDKALLIYEQIGFHPHLYHEIARCFLFRGTTEMKTGNLEVAKSNISKASELLVDMEGSEKSPESYYEDTARCFMQLGRITHTQMQEMGMPVEPELPLLEEGREQFRQAAEFYREVMHLNPGRLGAYGLLVMTLEIHIRMEIEQREPENAKLLLEDLDELYGQIPQTMRERPFAGRIVGVSRLNLAKLLIEEGEEEAAIVQLQQCQSGLEELQEEYPQLDRIESMIQECETLIAELVVN